jgi:hypothetical protein
MSYRKQRFLEPANDQQSAVAKMSLGKALLIGYYGKNQ